MKKIIAFFSLVFFNTAMLAQDGLADVQAKLAGYTTQLLPEKLYLHTDKNAYVAGDLVWFKIYAVDGIHNRPFAQNKVAYVELLDKENKPISRLKIALDEKGGNGFIELPFSLSSGYYTLRAYTSWMKNLGASHFFEKTVTVINTLKSPTAVAEKSSPAYTVQLFPEGGDLVSGLTSKVAFHLTDGKGHGVEAKGFLLNAANDTLTSFVPHQFGMGHFELKPQRGMLYKVTFVLSDGTSVSQNLPQPAEAGFVMGVEEAGNDQLRITVATNFSAGPSEIYLLAQTRQVVKAIQKVNSSNGLVVFLLEKKLLGPGVSQLTIFNHEKKPVCERLYFTAPPPQKQVNLKTSKDVYGAREQVSMLLNDSLTGKENMSLTVYQLDELHTEDEVNLYQYIWLTSELTGTVENPAYYFSANSAEVKHTADYLMLTQGWRRFRWQDIQNPPVPVFAREQHSQIITGQVTDVRTNDVAPEIQVYFSLPATPKKLFTAVSDSNGIVQFRVNDFYGPGELILQTNTQRDSFYKIDILSPFAETFSPKRLPPFAMPVSLQNALVNNSISMQAQYIYHAEHMNRFVLPAVADTLPFYGLGQYNYNLEDYVRFTTMEEVLREYVREVNVGVKGSGASLRFKLFNTADRDFYTQDILVMVDGIPFFNPAPIFSLDPLAIRRIEIVSQNFILGNAVYHGLANFLSYNTPYKGLPLDPKAVTIDEEGLQFQRQFYSPEYATDDQRNSRLPDLRTTLLWTPDFTTSKAQFYTGDNKGQFLAVLQGMDENGQAFCTSTKFLVK